MNTFFVYVTATNDTEAELISRTVVQERLAACANILGEIQSIYWWEGKLCDGQEVALVLKTSEDRKAELIARIKTLHSYECPAIVCLPIADGNPEYLAWIAEETTRQSY